MTMRDPGRLVDVVVVVPARDESATISPCLRSVGDSLRQAVAAGAVGRIAVAVVGHNCTDDTLDRAARALSGLPHVLVSDSTSTNVGDVRALGVRAVLDLLPRRVVRPYRSAAGRGSPREVWILNTDADSIVPATWVTDVLGAAAGGHQAVIGMAQLPDPTGMDAVDRQRNPAAVAAYRRIVRNGLHERSHEHVYGANLAVRADAYAAVGGFGSVALGEDRALLDALISHGRPIVRPRGVVVTTSDRRHGRAVGGLATLLDTLDHACAPDTEGG